jgi:hypothetical protein
MFDFNTLLIFTSYNLRKMAEKEGFAFRFSRFARSTCRPGSLGTRKRVPASLRRSNPSLKVQNANRVSPLEPRHFFKRSVLFGDENFYCEILEDYFKKMAEKEGFEPSLPVKVNTLSRR